MTVWTVEDYNALKSNYQKGILNIQYPSGGSVTFQTFKNMRALLDEAEAYLQNAGLLTKPPGSGMYSKVRYNRGRF